MLLVEYRVVSVVDARNRMLTTWGGFESAPLEGQKEGPSMASVFVLPSIVFSFLRSDLPIHRFVTFPV